MSLSKFQIIQRAFESRLLLSTEEEWHDLLGVYFETVVSKRYDERAIDNYYNILDSAANKMTGWGLEDGVDLYMKASDFYLNTDWGDRTHARSRKKFARKLFFLAATEGMRISSDEEDRKFGIRDADSRLLEAIFPDGFQNDSVVSVVFIILFCYGIIRPWNPEGKRRGDIEKRRVRTSVEELILLIGQLKEDMPPIGSLENLEVFDQWLSIIRKRIESDEELRGCSPLWLAFALEDVKEGCRSVMNPKSAKDFAESLITLRMPGIWIDDSDNGADRFWVFPANLQVGFCYRRINCEWTLFPYEFVCYNYEEGDFARTCYFFNTEGNMQLFVRPEKKVASTELAQAGFLLEDWNEEGLFSKITFHETMKPLPEWMDWRGFRRLNPTEDEYKKFRSLIESFYSRDPMLSLPLINKGDLITDTVDNIIGTDREYIYISDYRRPDRFILEESEDYPDYFIYLPYYSRRQPELSFLNVEISEEHPLYAFPLGKAPVGLGSSYLRLLARLLESRDNIMNISIIPPRETSFPILFFQGQAKSVPLDMKMLSEYGVLKFTSRQQLMNIDNKTLF